MKKWLKRAGKAILIILLLLGILETGLHILSRTQWFDTQLENALKNALGREVEVGNKGINFRGVFVEDIKIAEKGGFENGTFIEADRLRLRFSLLHLLHAHAKVNLIVLSNTTLRVTTYQDGTNSWDDFVTPTNPQLQEDPRDNTFPFNLTARYIRLDHLHLLYSDEQTPRNLDINNLTLTIKNFSLARAFPLTLIAEFTHKESTFERRIPITLKATLDLAKLNLSKAYAQIDALKVFYQHSSITLSGKVENFENPQANLKITLRNVNSVFFKDVADLPAFDLPQADITLKLASNLAQQTFTLHHLGVQAPGVEITAKGGVILQDTLQYEGSAHANVILGETGRWLTALAEPYQLVGTVTGNLNATHEKMAANITLNEVGADVPYAGRLANVNGQTDVNGNLQAKTGNATAKLTGKLNANPFTVDLNATQTLQKIKAVLDVQADELKLLALPEEPAETQTTATEQPAQAKPKTAWPLPPIELVANIKFGQVDVPYFTGKDVVFTSDIDGITPDLDQAHGTLRLTTGEGIIQDIYKLTDANPLTKVLFLSLNVTGKVFNSLNVLGVLNSLGSGLVSAVSGGDKDDGKPVKTQTILGPDGEPLEVPVVETDKQVSGEMAYDKFDTEVNFVRGLATIKEGTFVSPTMSFRLDGTADFNSGALDMTVHAAPGRHEVDGMMPLKLKIGGSVDDPQGSMQMLGSVTSLVTQTVTNNVVSRNVTKGIKGIFGLFKKKDKPEEQAETNAKTETDTATETIPKPEKTAQ